MKPRKPSKDSVIELIEKKGSLKRDVFELATEQFKVFKGILEAKTRIWKAAVEKIDPRLEVAFIDQGHYHAQLTIAGDVLLFNMHTNVFRFPDDSIHWKTGYLSNDHNRSYCASIRVYNFLADSLRFNRRGDIGYLVGRVLLNKENHFLVEGKREISVQFNDFAGSEFDTANMASVIDEMVKYCIGFDLLLPDFRTVQEISFEAASELKDTIQLKTGKRLGFQFGAEEDIPQG
ncbi:MAG TPA: hypothetical protein VJ911_06830 [Cryomorphaceae bacterium]|nr:hypothetical protein [Cryomorphaceae bacterium]